MEANNQAMRGEEAKRGPLRFIEHPFDIMEIPLAEKLKPEIFEETLTKMLKDNLVIQEAKMPAFAKQVITSKGRTFYDPYIYLGTGGTAYMYYRLYQYAMRTLQEEQAQNYLKLAVESLKVSLKIIDEKEQQKGDHEPSEAPSFFMGPPGLYTLAVQIYSHLDNKDRDAHLEKYFMKVINYAEALEDENNEDEILYGSAGYLYCLLVLRKIMGLKYQQMIDKTIEKVVDDLMISGVSDKNDFLEFYFPKKRKTPYMGAAHGTIGILYMMIKALQVLPALQRDPDFVGMVQNTVQTIISKQTGFGSFPFKSTIEVEEDDEPNHWCHGAPGAIPMLIEAYMTFKNSDYLDSALKGGKNVWRNGLLKKGFGLCHGTCGNAYALNALYKATGDAIWQQRARMFLLWTGDREVISAVANNDQSGFKIRGVPDTPFSLMEGSAGSITAYADFLGWTEYVPAKDLDIKFPGYEI